jgi:hypothetical protein
LALVFAPLGLGARRGLPAPAAATLLGPKMIRCEIAIKSGDSLRDFRIDRGRLVARYKAGALTLLERDGTRAAIPVSPTATVVYGRKTRMGVRGLRAGMQVAVARDGDRPSDSVFAAAPKATPQLPTLYVSYLLGRGMYKAEIALQDSGLHDYLLDQGRIRQVTATGIVVKEADGQLVTVPTTPFTRVKVNGKNGTYGQLRKGMMATTMRDGDKPADDIWAANK